MSTNILPSPQPGAANVEAVAKTILHDCLIEDGSLFTPGERIWTVENLDELHRHYVDAPDVAGDSFEEKMAKQLVDVSDGARQLFAELHVLNILPLVRANLIPAMKLKKIEGVLDGIDPPIAVPSTVKDAFSDGVFHGGMAFSFRRYAQLSLLVEFAEHFKRQPLEARQKLADEPLLMRDFVMDSPGSSEPAQRRALLYMFHPDYFLPIVSAAHSHNLRKALAEEYLPGGITDDIDVDLRAIDDAVIAETGRRPDYYSEPWRSRWRRRKSEGKRYEPEADVDDDSEDEVAEPRLYAIEDIINDGAFHPAEKLRKILQRWRGKKNVILQGAPGTGKTWLARRLAYALIGSELTDAVRAVQFHPNTSYEDFVRGWRPSVGEDGAGRLVLTDGPLLQHAERARSQPDIPHVLVIEEVNRGNPAQAFGEMLTLIENTKRGPREALSLSYPRSEDETYYLPENLYIIGTMNIADRSLALVDFALRRRFRFETLEPAFTPAWEKFAGKRLPNHPEIIGVIKSRVTELNKQISEDRTLGEAFQIGHSYFTPSEAQSNGHEWFEGVVEGEIGPLLAEYWFDDPARADSAVSALLV